MPSAAPWRLYSPITCEGCRTLGRQIRGRCRDRLDTRLLVVRDDCHRVARPFLFRRGRLARWRPFSTPRTSANRSSGDPLPISAASTRQHEFDLARSCHCQAMSPQMPTPPIPRVQPRQRADPDAGRFSPPSSPHGVSAPRLRQGGRAWSRRGKTTGAPKAHAATSRDIADDKCRSSGRRPADHQADGITNGHAAEEIAAASETAGRNPSTGAQRSQRAPLRRQPPTRCGT